MRILCDLDSIVVNLSKDWYALYNKDYDDDLTVERVKTWDTHLYVKPECGEKIYDYLSIPGFFYNLEPLDGAIDYLQALAAKYEVYIVTAAPLGTFEEKREWVAKWLPFLNVKKRVIACYNKYLIIGDVLIDDSPRNLEEFARFGHTTDDYRAPALCTIAYPYNKSVKSFVDCYAEDYKNPRKAWEQIYNYIIQL